jgi:ribose 5-phosphate isomerase A
MAATPSGVTLSTAVASPEQLGHIGKLASQLVSDGDRVGLGSGRAALSFVRELAARVASEGLTITGVPTSIKTEELARELGIPLASLDSVEQLDIAVVRCLPVSPLSAPLAHSLPLLLLPQDGADEVAPGMVLMKGGGGNLLREKITEHIATRLIIVVGEEKVVPHLGTNFPVFLEVIEFGRAMVHRALEGMGATVTQRMNGNVSPLCPCSPAPEPASRFWVADIICFAAALPARIQEPFLTDDGNPYLHAQFPPAALVDPVDLDARLQALPGIVETGIFVNMATEVFIAKVDGSVEHLTAAAS